MLVELVWQFLGRRSIDCRIGYTVYPEVPGYTPACRCPFTVFRGPFVALPLMVAPVSPPSAGLPPQMLNVADIAHPIVDAIQSICAERITCFTDLAGERFGPGRSNRSQ